MNGFCARFWFRIARHFCRKQLKLRKYNVAPREMMPEIKKRMFRTLAVRISAELRLPNRSASFTLFFGVWMVLAGLIQSLA